MSQSTTFIYQDQTPEKRLELLAANALRNEFADYARTLSDDEINAERIEYTGLAKTLEKLEEEKKKIASEYAGKIKAIKAVMAASLSIITNGKQDVNGKLFYFADQINGKMNAYDKNGQLVISRNLSESEKNTQLYIGDNVDQVQQGVPNDHGVEDVEHEDIVDAPVVKESLSEAKARKKRESKEKKDSPVVVAPELSEKEKEIVDKTQSRKKAKKKIDEAPSEPEGGILEENNSDAYGEVEGFDYDLDSTDEEPDPNQ